MQNTSTASLDNAQRLTRASSFVIVTTNGFISLQSAILRRLHCLFRRHVAPSSCLSLLNPAPHSLGFSPPSHRGRCFTSARSYAAQGHMSACRTRPAANPGGPQGGAQTGRRPGGGGWKEAEPPSAPKPNVAGVSQVPRQDLFRLLERTHGDTRRETRIHNNELQSALYNHIYKTYNNAHN